MGGETAIYSGIILPIESQVTPGGKESEIIATGKLGEIAKEAVKNVSAIIKRYFGEDIKETYDIYVQFLQTYEGVEGDSASIAVATAIISALKKIPIRQDTAMTGWFLKSRSGSDQRKRLPSMPGFGLCLLQQDNPSLVARAAARTHFL